MLNLQNLKCYIFKIQRNIIFIKLLFLRCNFLERSFNFGKWILYVHKHVQCQYRFVDSTCMSHKKFTGKFPVSVRLFFSNAHEINFCGTLQPISGKKKSFFRRIHDRNSFLIFTFLKINSKFFKAYNVRFL